MNDYNPYQASPSSESPIAPSSGGVTPTVVAHLSGTKFWVQLLGVLGSLGGVIMLISGLVMIVGGTAMGSSTFSDSGAPVAGGFMGVMGAFYLLIAAIYLFIAIKLFGYGSAIGSLRASGQVQHLELALDRQRSVWKTIGIMTLIMIVLMVVAMIGGAMAAFASMGKARSRAVPPSFPAQSAPGE